MVDLVLFFDLLFASLQWALMTTDLQMLVALCSLKIPTDRLKRGDLQLVDDDVCKDAKEEGIERQGVIPAHGAWVAVFQVSIPALFVKVTWFGQRGSTGLHDFTIFSLTCSCEMVRFKLMRMSSCSDPPFALAPSSTICSGPVGAWSRRGVLVEPSVCENEGLF